MSARNLITTNGLEADMGMEGALLAAGEMDTLWAGAAGAAEVGAGGAAAAGIGAGIGAYVVDGASLAADGSLVADATAGGASAAGWGATELTAEQTAQIAAQRGLDPFEVDGLQAGPTVNGAVSTPAPTDWGGIASGALKMAGPAMSIYSGIRGMDLADQMRKQAQQAQLKADPFGTSGGRATADAQLQALMTNPGAISASDPAFKARMQGAQRAMAGMGQDSGAMAVAGANASSTWYDQRLASLGGLATAPGAAEAQRLGLSGAGDAAGLESKGLASIGYGITTGIGGNTGSLSPDMIAMLRQIYGQKG
jgi:hypothetical protein